VMSLKGGGSRATDATRAQHVRSIGLVAEHGSDLSHRINSSGTTILVSAPSLIRAILDHVS
jgi:hypothetical protein